MKTLFFTNTLNYRGTTVAITDYARYNQSLLGNESIIVYNNEYGYEKDIGTEKDVIDSLSQEFKVIGSSNIEKIIDDELIDVAYFIRGGNIEPLPSNCKTAVHAVFQHNSPHGDVYAYVSKWLSDVMSGGTLPYVPHIINLPEPNTSLRNELGIPADKIVIGRIGGYYTFDINEVKQYINDLVQRDDRFVFLFVGTEPFINHPNVLFLNEIHSPQAKSNFIASCDCMLHARQRGESFGIAIAEFLFHNKPVMSWNDGHDRNHIEMLKDSGTLYNNIAELDYILHNIKDYNQDWSRRVVDYQPHNVMKIFKDVYYS